MRPEDNGQSFDHNTTESIKEEVEETKSFLTNLINEEKKIGVKRWKH